MKIILLLLALCALPLCYATDTNQPALTPAKTTKQSYKQTVTVTYDTRKTDLETLLKAFEKIGKPATVKE